MEVVTALMCLGFIFVVFAIIAPLCDSESPEDEWRRYKDNKRM